MSNLKVTLENTGIDNKELTKFSRKVEKIHEVLNSMAYDEN